MADEPDSNAAKTRLDNRVVYPLVVLLLLIIGGGVFAALILTKTRPSGEPQEELGRLVRVFKAEKTSHLVAVTAYGTSRASQQWTAIAEVKGRAAVVHGSFEPGEILSAGTLLLEIDRTDYELAVTRLEAEAHARQIELGRLDQTETNLREIVKFQKEQVRLAARESRRLGEALAGRATSQSALETAELAYQLSRTRLQETLNGLALLPAQRDLAQAQLDAANAQLSQARRNLSKCEIRLPFPARCQSKSIEPNQYMAVGERLGTFLSLQIAEVIAMVDTRKMPLMFPGGIEEMGTADFLRMSRNGSFWKYFRIPVEVRWALGGQSWVWHGRVARIASSLDADTRTMPVTIEVPDPYENVQPGVRPPLIPDVFCEVTAYGKTLENVVVIPRDALRDDRVYLLRQGKLHIEPVTVAALEQRLAVIELAAEGRSQEGIKQGDLVVLSDVPRAEIRREIEPVSEGMPLRWKLVPNPVKPRIEIDFPEEIFEEVTEPADQQQPMTEEPAGEPPVRRPAVADPVPETTP